MEVEAMPADNGRYTSHALEVNYKKAITELLMLFLLSEQDRSISELTEIVRVRSNGVINIVFPYAALYRLEEAGHIKETEKRVAPDGRRRQYMKITEAGKKHLKQLLEIYRRYSKGVADALGEAGK